MKIINFESKGNSLYSNDNLWIKMNKNKARIGIEKSLIQKIKEISDIELTYLDNQIHKGDSIATLICSNDKVIEIPSPVTGMVVNLNEELELDTDLIINDPSEKGWLVEIELFNDNDGDLFNLFNAKVNFDAS